MTAPICATSLTGARRSRRAISESCSVAGSRAAAAARELVAIAGVRQQARFQHGLGQLLDEQRDAVGAHHDLLDDIGRQRLVA